MTLHSRKDRGFSLIEMLVVLVIIGILSVVGITMMLGNRQAGAVRALLDELEGSLSNARQVAVATGHDVAIVNWGIWEDGTNRLVVAYGDASLTDAQIQTIASGLLVGVQPAATVTGGQSVAVPLHFLPNVPSHTMARVALVGTDSWADAMRTTTSGATNRDITSVTPFKTTETMNGLVTNANNLFKTALNRTVISGSNKRFTSTFIIPVVGTTRSGGSLPGAPMGLIVVMSNGASIYKFYNPGVRDGDGQWRRI